MPLGNLTSQFFANIYLNELDQFVKHHLKTRYYIRYVDDFVIFEKSKETLENYKIKIDNFLKDRLNIKLHPDKSKIIPLEHGTNFLGFRVFYHHKLIRKKNLRKFEKKFHKLRKLYEENVIEREKMIEVFEGWIAYISHANTYKHRRHLTRTFTNFFPIKPESEIKNVTKHERFIQKTETSKYQFTTQKTLLLLKKGLTIQQITLQREIKEATVWEHLAQLVEYNQISIWKIIPKDKITRILQSINTENDSLKEIKQRINNPNITFNEINCILAHIKYENKNKPLKFHINTYKKLHCLRKCYLNPKQRQECSKKFDNLLSKSQNLEMKKEEFLHLFNNNLNICALPEQEKLRTMSWNEFISRYSKIRSRSKT